MQNFLAVQAGLDLSRDEIVRLARNSFEASILSDEMKAGYIDELERYATTAA